MTKIYKAKLNWGDREATIHGCLRILHVGRQDSEPCIWYVHTDKTEFEPAEGAVKKEITVRWTGEAFPLDREYLGTVMTEDEGFVIHLFC